MDSPSDGYSRFSNAFGANIAGSNDLMLTPSTEGSALADFDRNHLQAFGERMERMPAPPPVLALPRQPLQEEKGEDISKARFFSFELLFFCKYV